MHEVSELVRAEIARYDWSRLRCGCMQTAEHVAERLSRFASADSYEEILGYTLVDHLEISSNLFEVAVPAASVMLAALAGPVSEYTQEQFASKLLELVYGESHHSETALGRTHLGDEVRYRVREGLWVILNLALNQNSEDALEILAAVDLDEERSAYFSEVVSQLPQPRPKRRSRG